MELAAEIKQKTKKRNDRIKKSHSSDVPSEVTDLRIDYSKSLDTNVVCGSCYVDILAEPNPLFVRCETTGYPFGMKIV